MGKNESAINWPSLTSKIRKKIDSEARKVHGRTDWLLGSILPTFYKKLLRAKIPKAKKYSQVVNLFCLDFLT